jgi:hypothetical protein
MHDQLFYYSVTLHYTWPIIAACVCSILSDIQSDLYCMIKYFIIIC